LFQLFIKSNYLLDPPAGGRREERRPADPGEIFQPEESPQRELIQEIGINSYTFPPQGEKVEGEYANLDIFPAAELTYIS
jgi:hypothetical protein